MFHLSSCRPVPRGPQYRPAIPRNVKPNHVHNFSQVHLSPKRPTWPIPTLSRRSISLISIPHILSLPKEIEINTSEDAFAMMESALRQSNSAEEFSFGLQHLKTHEKNALCLPKLKSLLTAAYNNPNVSNYYFVLISSANKFTKIHVNQEVILYHSRIICSNLNPYVSSNEEISGCVIKNAHPQFEHIIRHCYIQHLVINNQNVEWILESAKRFDITNLIKECEDFIMAKKMAI